ncbi:MULTISPECIES: hypothetical protein [Lactobacillaceae]|uniref:hypothetical protein n=1 Tax=Lactobacillaceae TaxID=33958 RepID=UPI000F772893|nr:MULTISPECIES: hypothetical protein [Lactobacillaceae]
MSKPRSKRKHRGQQRTEALTKAISDELNLAATQAIQRGIEKGMSEVFAELVQQEVRRQIAGEDDSEPEDLMPGDEAAEANDVFDLANAEERDKSEDNDEWIEDEQYAYGDDWDGV